MAIFINPEDALKFIEYLYQIRQLGERTVKHYLSYYNKLNPERIDDEDYVSSFIIKHGNNSVVRGMMKNYLEMKELPVILPKRAKGNKVKKLIRTISQKEIVKVREYLYNKNFKHGLIFDLIHQGALRRAEVPTIKIGSFKWVEWIEDVDKMCKLIVLGKGNKERIVLIKPEIVEKLLMKLIPNGIYGMNQIERLDQSDKLLFANRNGKPITECFIYAIIKRGTIACLGRDIRPHELRHHRATEMEKKGIQIGDIKNYLGHSRIGTTEIYLHKTGEESIDTIEEGLNRKDTGDVA